MRRDRGQEKTKEDKRRQEKRSLAACVLYSGESVACVLLGSTGRIDRQDRQAG